eukprot:SAG31_NODE_1413_length_8459_cov_7.720215_7_plen_253_part_00
MDLHDQLEELDRQATELADDGLELVAVEVMAEAISAANAANEHIEAARRQRAAAAFCRQAAADGAEGAAKMLVFASAFEDAAQAATAAADRTALELEPNRGPNPEPAGAGVAQLEYKVVQRTVTRAAAELDSKRRGQLMPGQKIRPIAQYLLPPHGPLRLQLGADDGGGWVSESGMNGVVLLEPLGLDGLTPSERAAEIIAKAKAAEAEAERQRQREQAEQRERALQESRRSRDEALALHKSFADMQVCTAL